jgi:hypothetical protein
MELRDCCAEAQCELTGWKNKVDDVVRKLDRVSSGDKTRVVPYVNELHMISEELDDRIRWFQMECPSQGRADVSEQESKSTGSRPRWDEEWGFLPG